MDDNSLEKNLEKYPYLRSLTEFVLFEEKDEVLKMVNGKQLLIGNLNISTLFLEKILKDKKYFSYAYKCLKGEIASFNVDYITDGLITGFSYRKGDIVNGLEKLINDQKIKLSFEEENNLNLLKSFISFDKFTEEFGKLHYKASVDNISYTVSVLDIINLMQMPDEDFTNLCHNPLEKEIMGIFKEHFVYLAYDFFNSNKKVIQQ